MAEQDDDCMITRVSEVALRWVGFKRPKPEPLDAPVEAEIAAAIVSPLSQSATTSTAATVQTQLALQRVKQEEGVDAHPLKRSRADLEEKAARMKAELSQLEADMREVDETEDLRLEVERLRRRLVEDATRTDQKLQEKDAELAGLKAELQEERNRHEKCLDLVLQRQAEAEEKRRNAQVATHAQRAIAEALETEVRHLKEAQAEWEAEKQQLEQRMSMAGEEIPRAGDSLMDHSRNRVPGSVQLVHRDDVLALLEWLPPAHVLEQAYRFDRQMFFLLYDLEAGQTLEHVQLVHIWQGANVDNRQNLFAEILVRGDLLVEDFFRAFLLVGDLAARAYLYWRELEQEQARRRQCSQDVTSNGRFVNCTEWTAAIVRGFDESTNWQTKTVKEWRNHIFQLRKQFDEEEWVTEMIESCKERLSQALAVDVHPSVYFYTYRFLQTHLLKLEQAVSSEAMGALNLDRDCRFKKFYDLQVAPERLLGMDFDLAGWIVPQHTNRSDHRFLGKYENLFVKAEHQPEFLTWDALLWLGRDFGGYSEPLLHDIDVLICREKHLRHERDPIQVELDPRWCKTPRRYLWKPDAKLDTVWYNWCLMEGRWDTPDDCYRSYGQFFQNHRCHSDPVCFRQAVFCAVLSRWCHEFQIVIDPRLGARQCQDGHLVTKLKYQSARRVRIFELMCSTHFLAGAHNVVLDERGGNRFAAMEKFQQMQRTGEYDFRKKKYQDLHEKVDEHNKGVRAAGVGKLMRMPLEWKDEKSIPGVDRLLSKTVPLLKSKQ